MTPGMLRLLRSVISGTCVVPVDVLGIGSPSQ